MNDKAQGQADGAVRDVVETWTDAERDGDATKLEGVLHESFRGIGLAGFVLDRGQWLDRYRSGDLENRSFDVAEAEVRVFPGAALVVGVLEQETSYRGHDSSGRFRLNMALVDDDGWTIAGAHIGPLKEPGGAFGPPGGGDR